MKEILILEEQVIEGRRVMDRLIDMRDGMEKQFMALAVMLYGEQAVKEALDEYIKQGKL